MSPGSIPSPGTNVHLVSSPNLLLQVFLRTLWFSSFILNWTKNVLKSDQGSPGNQWLSLSEAILSKCKLFLSFIFFICFNPSCAGNNLPPRGKELKHSIGNLSLVPLSATIVSYLRLLKCIYKQDSKEVTKRIPPFHFGIQGYNFDASLRVHSWKDSRQLTERIQLDSRKLSKVSHKLNGEESKDSRKLHLWTLIALYDILPLGWPIPSSAILIRMFVPSFVTNMSWFWTIVQAWLYIYIEEFYSCRFHTCI